MWFDGINPVTYSVQTDRDLVVETALNMFSNDMLEVTEAYAIPEAPSKAKIHIYQLDKASDKEGLTAVAQHTVFSNFHE